MDCCQHGVVLYKKEHLCIQQYSTICAEHFGLCSSLFSQPSLFLPSLPALELFKNFSMEEDGAVARIIFLEGQCHEMDIFVGGLNILISTFCECSDGFQGLAKAFHPIQLFLFICFFENTY